MTSVQDMFLGGQSPLLTRSTLYANYIKPTERLWARDAIGLTHSHDLAIDFAQTHSTR